VQRAAVVAEDASQQQLATLLLEAAKAGWQLEQQPLQLLLAEMLRKQAADLRQSDSRSCNTDELSSIGSKTSSCSSRETQHSRQDLSSRSGTSDSCLVSSSTCSSRGGSSNASSSQAARLYGLSNHRLKSSLSATAAAATWAPAMTVASRMAALVNCSALALQLDISMLPLLAVHICCLAGPALSTSSSSVDGGQQLLQLPEGLAAVLWQERERVTQQLTHAQRQAMLQLWRAAGLCD
jgi:hypothetical protein